MGGNKLGNESKTVEVLLVVQGTRHTNQTHLSVRSGSDIYHGRGRAAAVSRLSLTHASGLTTSRWDRIVMVTNTRALPLSSQSRLPLSIRQTETHTTYYSYLSRTRPAAFCDLSLLMHDIDRSQGEGNPARVKRTRRVFPRPTDKASSACALRCSGAANSGECVRNRAIEFVADFVSRVFF